MYKSRVNQRNKVSYFVTVEPNRACFHLFSELKRTGSSVREVSVELRGTTSRISSSWVATRRNEVNNEISQSRSQGTKFNMVLRAKRTPGFGRKFLGRFEQKIGNKENTVHTQISSEAERSSN